MVVRKDTSQPEYDDLDAINDFIKASCGQDTKSELPNNNSNDTASTENVNLQIHGQPKHPSTDGCDQISDKVPTFRKFCGNVPIHIHEYRTLSSTTANDFSTETNQSSEHTSITRASLLNPPAVSDTATMEVATSHQSPCENQSRTAKLENSSNGIIKIDRDGVINKRNIDGKCVFSRPNKVLLCDVVNLKGKSLRKQFRSANRFELGNIRVEHTSFADVLPVQAQKTAPAIESREISPVKEPISSLMGTLNKIKIKHVAVGNHLGDVGNTYLTGNTDNTILMDKAENYIDFSAKELYDLIERMTGTNTKTENYARLTENMLICYNHEPCEMKNLKYDDAYFILPTNTSMCYVENHRISLHDVRIFLLTGNSLFSRSWLFCYSVINRSNLYDITDLEIFNVMRLGSDYNISIKTLDGCEMVMVPDLDLVLCKNGKYHWYRMKNIQNYLKWITAIQLRCRK